MHRQMLTSLAPPSAGQYSPSRGQQKPALSCPEAASCDCATEAQPVLWHRGGRPGPMKGQRAEVFSMTGHQASVTALNSAALVQEQPLMYRTDRSTMPIKPYLQVQLADQARPWSWGLCIPALAWLHAGGDQFKKTSVVLRKHEAK